MNLVEDQDGIADLREKILNIGFQTVSIVDTIDRVASVFSVVRVVLLIIGFIALSVAALGMFNTLTVSLLEKTREVGLLKVMGFKSSEIQQLFLAEAMIISVYGGVLGLILGFLMGKLISLIISVVAISQGQPYMDVSYIPISLAIGVVVISSLIGIGTGYYPARRATEISALNALRYE